MALIKRMYGPTETVLPTISREKQAAVRDQLDALAGRGSATIEEALRVLPSVRARLASAQSAALLPGLAHRFEVVVGVLEDSRRTEQARSRAAAAALYVDNVRDVIPDTLGVIGMIDDDYALRVVLKDVGLAHDPSILHWSEKISLLWDDLPFLQGVNLQRGHSAIPVTWLDRVNSYVSYLHVLGSERSPLVILQPSIVCTPLHTLISLVGLLVLDAVTSSQRKVEALLAGQAYSFDRHVAVFEGVSTDARFQGWLRLRFRNGSAYAHPDLAYQMVAAKPERALSDAGRFEAGAPGRDPLRRFFNWDSPIGPGSISNQILLVSSRRRALEILEDVESNGVRLLDHGLTLFIGARPDSSDVRGAVLLVVPSLGVARLLLQSGVRIHSMLIDGYERLSSGRHDLPFLINSSKALPVICWCPAGYFPSALPTWLPAHRCLEVSPEDLADILELDDATTDSAHASLWEAATGATVRTRTASAPSGEVAVVDAIDAYLERVHVSEALPDYWQYQLVSLARTLRLLVAATPAEWSMIRQFSAEWSLCVEAKWSTLRRSAVAALVGLREAEGQVRDLIANVQDAVNSSASALAAFMFDQTDVDRKWSLVCDRPEQKRIGASAVRSLGLGRVEPVLLRDLEVCAACVTTGWVSSSFARRLWAHTPRVVVALVDESGRRQWERAVESRTRTLGEPLLGAVGVVHDKPKGAAARPSIEQEHYGDDRELEITSSTEKRVPCVFVWVSGESQVKVLQPDSRIVVEEGDVVRERLAGELRPDDRVILGSGTGRWSPADEFTGAVVEAVGASHPEVVRTAKEWRRALREVCEVQRLSIPELRDRLSAAGVEREDQTIDGWLDLERPSPIAPRGLRNELAALWPIVQQYARASLDDVTAACTRLRALRAASGRALLQLWKGHTADLGVDDTWLEELVDRLREEVQVYEVESVAVGEVPDVMLGWWIPSTLTARFESEPATARADDELEEKVDARTD
jgi:uncharacterized membrane protein YkvA (DUF1232 family)